MKILSKSLILPLLLFIQLSVLAQNNTQDKIKQVENGLVGNIQIEGEQPGNLLNRMAYYKIPGLSIAIIQNYKIAWAKGYGMANDSAKIPVTAKTLFQAASISKSLNSVGVLKLVQDKKLDLNTDINVYLKSWKFPYDSVSKGKKITIANLLSHSAGLTVHGFGGYEPGVPLPTIVQVLNGENPANSPAVKSMFEPGLRYEYSGGGTTITQMIVMDITHMPYADYMKKEVLKPLGMTGSTYAQPPYDVDQNLLAVAYSPDGKPKKGNYHIYPEQAAAGLWTNPTDLAKYIIETQLAYEGKSAKVLNQETTKIRLSVHAGNDVGFGAFIDKKDSVLYFSHSGVNEGFRCIYYGSMEGGNGVVVMVNSDNDNVIPELINSVAKVYNFKGLFHSNIKKVASVPAEVLKSYAGKFYIGPPRTLTISEDGGKLYALAAGEGKRELYPQSNNRFFMKDLPYELEFNKDADGKIHVTLIDGGNKMELKRAE
ncbi:serine hydrolase [Mucilaginibacter rubeus]|nr:serine hydrolase [Mucilaginibacter rubeus]